MALGVSILSAHMARIHAQDCHPPGGGFLSGLGKSPPLFSAPPFCPNGVRNKSQEALQPVGSSNQPADSQHLWSKGQSTEAGKTGGGESFYQTAAPPWLLAPAGVGRWETQDPRLTSVPAALGRERWAAQGGLALVGRQAVKVEEEALLRPHPGSQPFPAPTAPLQHGCRAPHIPQSLCPSSRRNSNVDKCIKVPAF